MWYLSTNISSGQTNCSVLASGAHTSSADLVDIECFLLNRREKMRNERTKGGRGEKLDFANDVMCFNKRGHLM